jgi:predicted flap endonuclease-1-like 5' DNA nuclease
MNAFFTFILGLLVGWLAEWLIDFFYWRKRCAEREAVLLQQANSRSSALSIGTSATETVTKNIIDDLKIIKGIGPVIEGKLNDSGIYTFEQLGNLTPSDLEHILGNVIERLANEEALIQQARNLTGRR